MSLAKGRGLSDTAAGLSRAYQQLRRMCGSAPGADAPAGGRWVARAGDLVWAKYGRLVWPVRVRATHAAGIQLRRPAARSPSEPSLRPLYTPDPGYISGHGTSRDGSCPLLSDVC